MSHPVCPARSAVERPWQRGALWFPLLVILAVGGTVAWAGDAPPSVAIAALATPNPVTGTTTVLSVLGADDGGAANLTYTWSTTGTPPAALTFSVNGTNGARRTTARCTKPGAYAVQCTIRDAAGQTAVSNVGLTVVPTLASIALTPMTARVNPGAAQRFTATAKDQFAVALAVQPTLTWTISGGGGIDASGLFTAGATPGGPFTVTVASGGKSRTAAVTINAAPSVATAAAASANPVSGTTVGLSALGADDLGEPALTYAWSTTGTPPAAVGFTPNRSNAARNSTATFRKAGSYALLCTIRDRGGLTVTTAVTVTVAATPTTVRVAPTTLRLNPGAVRTCTASVRDQFAAVLSPQPAVTWTASGGTITSAGVFTAGPPGGPFAITATSAGPISGSSGVTINAPPTIVTAAKATPNPVTGTSAAVAVLGADDLGEAALTYTWSTTGTVPAPVAVSPNGTNAAKAATVTFAKVGSYALKCTIADASGLKVTSTVTVVVQPTATAIAVSPAATTVLAGATQAFTATVNDQFGAALKTQPTRTWSVSGGGTISAAGLFTAGGVAGGPFAVTAATTAGGGLSRSASVTVTDAPPTVVTMASANPNPVLGTSAALSVLGADSAGGSASTLTYIWTTIGAPPAPVAFSVNGTNGAKTATATFSRIGAYTLSCTITNSRGKTAQSSVVVTVVPTVTVIAVAPATASVALNGVQPFTAVATDQFGAVIAPAPMLAWTVTGSGSIDGAGVFTAGTAAGGPFTVNATTGAVSGLAAVTVVNASPSVATAATPVANPVIGTSVALSALGADDGGEAALTYTWTTVGTPPAPVQFTPNGSNDAKATVAMFSAAGSYSFQCAIRDAGGHSVVSTVSVGVTATPTSVLVSPAADTVALGGSASFAAAVQDQFGATIVPAPSVVWSVAGGGSIAAQGVFTAGAVAGGPFTVTAQAGSVAGTAAITVVNTAPTLLVAASALLDPLTGTSADLTVLGEDDGGEGALTYTWSVIGTPPATPGFSVNGSNAAKSTAVTVTKAGTYVLEVTVRDAGNLTVTNRVNVTFDATATTVVLTKILS